MKRLHAKIPLFVDVGWGVVTMFCLVGLFVKEEAAMVGLILAVLCWASGKILSQAASALEALRKFDELSNGDEK